VIIKMGKARYAWVTLGPLAWLATVTLTAGVEKVFAAEPRLGFLSHARLVLERGGPDAARLAFNDRLDAALALFFMAVVVAVILASAREWWLVLTKRKAPRLTETPFVETALASGD
jgi:carbon starvation protein